LLHTPHKFSELQKDQEFVSEVRLKVQTRLSQIKNQKDHFQFIES